MANIGIAPPDLTTDVGQLRIVLDDLDYTPVPDEEGLGDYKHWSDGELEGFLAIGGGSVLRGVGHAYLSMSALAARDSKVVKDQDLSVDLTKRAGDLRATAQFYFEQADDVDDADGGADIFDMHDLGFQGSVIPEATIPLYGRVYTWDRIR